jgi:CheY-like chemotaxis protein
MASLNKSLKILVVEDNKYDQMIIMGFLKRLNHSAIIANNGKEAIEKFKKNNFNCILMDIRMPEMDGKKATQIIREIEKSDKKQIPIIAVTAVAPYENDNEYMEAGMNAYILKPISPDLLKDILQKIINNN